MPNNIRMWTVDDVAKWMESLSLGQYADAFREATVDGPFLLELREEDLVQVLGVSHKLHVRKILVSREKLKPLSEQEKAMKDQVEYEVSQISRQSFVFQAPNISVTQGKADERRRNMGVPDLETVFSQGRNGRTKRLEESLNLGTFTAEYYLVFIFHYRGQQVFRLMVKTAKETRCFLSLVRIATSEWLKCL